ncbi:MAG: D-aminoacyl-tRNA deacylase [Lentisphaerales bacterium]|nr:D-aminoacyl-tRNA deacylase [Lentisphaerales bacterium]
MIAGEIKGEIDNGFVILLGVRHDDTEKDVEYLVDKMSDLRVFTDANGKFNDSLMDRGYDLLVISQFTLYANTRKGKRPGFTESARPEKAILLYELFNERCKALGVKVQSGEFGADMKVTIHNDGPVTIMLDSEDKIKR